MWPSRTTSASRLGGMVRRASPWGRRLRAGPGGAEEERLDLLLGVMVFEKNEEGSTCASTGDAGQSLLDGSRAVA